VNATPKFYVDGQRIDGALPLEGLMDRVRLRVRADGDPVGLTFSPCPAQIRTAP
jgi:hypothetical protein